MARVQQRDREAFTRLLDRHLAGLQRFARRVTGNSADADEVAQEAFLRIWSHANSWHAGRVRFTTWVYRIARNLAIDRLRRRHDAGSDELATLADESAEAPQLVEAERRTLLTRRAIAELPERQRTALALCHFDGMSNQDAAAVMQVSVDALESLLARARRTLRTNLKPLIEGNSPCNTHR